MKEIIIHLIILDGPVHRFNMKYILLVMKCDKTKHTNMQFPKKEQNYNGLYHTYRDMSKFKSCGFTFLSLHVAQMQNVFDVQIHRKQFFLLVCNAIESDNCVWCIFISFNCNVVVNGISCLEVVSMSYSSQKDGHFIVVFDINMYKSADEINVLNK